jgi:ABC-type Mn2+/Zn2+ transport system permease subunit
METLREILDPQFLLRNSLYAGVLVGLVCPLVGVYLVVRRLIFMGVALPQVSSCGIACAFALHTWGLVPHLEEESEHLLAFFGSTVLTVAVILLLSFLERRGHGTVEGRLGTAYVLAGAWSILLLVTNPYGDHGLLDRLKGEIIAVGDRDLLVTVGMFGFVLFAFWLFQKELLLVSFDRDLAVTLKKNVVWWDFLLFLLIGLTVSKAVLSVGPLVTFGFLLLPPLIARQFAANMRQFAWLSSIIGAVTAVAGFAIAYRWDLPVGPTDVALLGCVLGVSVLGRKLLVDRMRAPKPVAT